MPADSGSVTDIPWAMMDSMISGKSGIDVPRLYLSNLADANDFLHAYGYRWENAEDRAEVEALRSEAISFIERHLINDEPELDVLPLVRDEHDVRKILLWASAPVGGERQLWSCNVLRVMHTFAHCGSYFQKMFSEQIREQVLDRFESHVRETPDGLRLGEGPDSVPLYTFQFRGHKSRDSLAMKLLQKAENVGADIFDWVGLRFVTMTRFDALLVAKYLRSHNLVVFCNVRPGRSRNTLIDTEQLRHDTAAVQDLVRAGKLAEHEALDRLREMTRDRPYPDQGVRSANPFSLSTYHSIQFTVTQQVRVPNPYLGGVGNVLSAVDKRAQAPASFLSKALHKAGMRSEVTFFFPYEVQILDKESFIGSRTGRASHAVYKARQRYSVKKRLFGSRILEKTGAYLQASVDPFGRDVG